jgi:hypothetical protein
MGTVYLRSDPRKNCLLTLKRAENTTASDADASTREVTALYKPRRLSQKSFRTSLKSQIRHSVQAVLTAPAMHPMGDMIGLYIVRLKIPRRQASSPRLAMQESHL